jgi:hypothetical protein
MGIFRKGQKPEPRPDPLDEPIGESVTMGFHTAYREHLDERIYWTATPIPGDATLEFGISSKYMQTGQDGNEQEVHQLNSWKFFGKGDTREAALADVIRQVTRLVRKKKLKKDVEMTFEI